MDISILNNSSIKIRIRRSTFVVDPIASGVKISCDGIILLNGNFDLSKVVDYRIVINGPGEYEINGVKILGVRVDKGLVYNISGDGFGLILGRMGEVSKIKDEAFSACQIAILNADGNFNQSIATELEPKVVILYGDKAENGAKILGKDNLTPSKKFTITKDKLPEEMEVVVLG